MDYYCSRLNYPLGIILIGPSYYVVFISLYLLLKLYYLPDPKLWRKPFILPNFCVTLVRNLKKKHLTTNEGHVIFQVLIFSYDQRPSN